MKLKTFFPCLTWMCPFQYAELCCIYSEPIAKCLVWNTGLMSPETWCWSPWQPKELCPVPSWKKAWGMLNSGLQYIAGCFFIYLTPHCCLQLFPNTFEKKNNNNKNKKEHHCFFRALFFHQYHLPSFLNTLISPSISEDFSTWLTWPLHTNSGLP